MAKMPAVWLFFTHIDGTQNLTARTTGQKLSEIKYKVLQTQNVLSPFEDAGSQGGKTMKTCSAGSNGWNMNVLVNVADGWCRFKFYNIRLTKE